MSTTDTPAGIDADAALKEWLSRLNGLVESAERWAGEFGWSTRRIDKRLEDSQIGTYRAPALLLQEGTIRVLLDPIARSAPGADGVVDLYLMPAYDDIASLYFSDGAWRLQYAPPGSSPHVVGRDGPSNVFEKELFRQVLESMKTNGA